MGVRGVLLCRGEQLGVCFCACMTRGEVGGGDDTWPQTSTAAATAAAEL